MKVLIAGAHGQLARALINTAPPQTEIIGLSKRDMDITQANQIKNAIEKYLPDIFINCAAYTAVDHAEMNPNAAEYVNNIAVGHIVDICAASAIPVVHFSTDYVFNGQSRKAYVPADPVAPLNIYGHSKCRGEKHVLKIAGNLVIRSSWIYSVYGSNFVKKILSALHDKSEIHVVEDQTGTPTHAQSLACATWELIKIKSSGLYHYTDDGLATWYSFAKAIQDMAYELNMIPRKINIIAISSTALKTVATRPSFSVLDNSEIKNILRYPVRHWSEELRIMLTNLKGFYA